MPNQTEHKILREELVKTIADFEKEKASRIDAYQLIEELQIKISELQQEKAELKERLACYEGSEKSPTIKSSLNERNIDRYFNDD